MTITEIGNKEFDSQIEEQTVVKTPSRLDRSGPAARVFLLQVAEASQSITPWGYSPVRRDKELRSFWRSESWLASVVYSVGIRNASFAWHVVGSDPEKKQPRNTINAVTRILKQSDRGKGWRHLILKTCEDLYTQDNAAFWEIIRNGNRPDSPVINIAHLDAGRCQRTGDPEYPVIYTDSDGREHFMPYYRIRTLEEMPSAIETAYDMQYCAVTRALLAAEIIQSISTYKLEKVSGNWTRAIHFIAGSTQTDIDDALAQSQEQILNTGAYRYSVPLIVSGLDPTATLSHVQIDLASLPDNFDEDTSFKWYVAQLASAFGVDYQEIAPLMTGNLGSSQQSEIMHLKTRGKGPAVIMGLFEDKINELFPDNVEFKFLEQDIRSEHEKADTSFIRSKDRAMRVKTGELTPKAARELAVMVGDMPRWLKDEVDAEEQENEQEQEMQQQGSEFGATQLEEGVNNNGERQPMDMEGVRALQKAISIHPHDFLQSWYKASMGQPSGTVIAPIWMPSRAVDKLKGDLMMRWTTQRVRYLPVSDYHITLVHSPLVDDAEFHAVSKTLSQYDTNFEFTVSSSLISAFDTPNGKAIILKIDDSPLLTQVQNYLYEQFNRLKVPLSEYSKPDAWTPHVTLAYLDGSVPFEDIVIDPLRIWVEYPMFTRSSYYTEYFTHDPAVSQSIMEKRDAL